MKNKDKNISKSTYVVHASTDPLSHHGIVNVPVYHTSTILKPNLDDYRNSRGKYDYGRIGTPTSEASEKAVAELYQMDDAVATPSGLSAISLGILGSYHLVIMRCSQIVCMGQDGVLLNISCHALELVLIFMILKLAW